MKGKIAWKLVLTVLVLAWAVSAMVPFTDTPFETYIANRATKNADEFANILKEAGSALIL